MSQLSTPSPIRPGFVTQNVWGRLVRELNIEDGLPRWAVRDAWVRNGECWGRVRDIRAGVITVFGWRLGEDGRAMAETFTLWASDWAAWEVYDPDQGLPEFGDPHTATRFERDFEP